MRIAHLVAHADLNGVSTSCRTLINAQLRHGHEIMLVTMPDAWLKRQSFEGSIEIVTSHLKTRISEIRRIGNALRRWQPAIVHCHGSKANKYGMAFRIAAGGPVVTTAHSRNIQIPPSFFRAVIAPSQPTADFHQHYNRVSRKNLTVIPHLFERPDRKTLENAPRLAKFGAEADDIVIGIVGSIDARKNQIDGIRILKRVLGTHKSARLIIVGGTDGKDTIPEWDATLNDPAIRDRIILTGHQDNGPGLIDQFDILLCTSKIEEGPIVVLEAMSLDVPVVSTSVGMVPWLIRDGVDGFVYDIGKVDDAAAVLGLLVSDAELRIAIGSQGRLRLEAQCNERTIVKQIDTVYERVARAAGTWVDV